MSLSLAAFAAGMIWATASQLPSEVSQSQGHLDREVPTRGGISLPSPEKAPTEVTTVVVVPRAGGREAPKYLTPVPGNSEWLPRQLQRELTRVGCYALEINGEWTPATRKAMNDFVERVNAILPTEAPNPVLLALVQGHRGVVCGGQCPEGQGLTKDNRCLPRALLAITPKKSAQPAIVLAGSTMSAPSTQVSATEGGPIAPVPAQRPRQRALNSSKFGPGIFGIFGW